MIRFTSSDLAIFLSQYKLTNQLCTIYLDVKTKSANVLVESDTLKYLLRIHQLESLDTDEVDVASFSFYIPEAVKFMTDESTIEFKYSKDVKTVQVNCTSPSFNTIVEPVELAIAEFDTNYKFVEYPELKYVSAAIRASKGLAQELMTSVTVELTDTLWCVHTPQSCAYGNFTGLKGTIPVNIFEKVYPSGLRVGFAQPTTTSIISKVRYKTRDVYVLAPIQNEFSLSSSVPKLIERCTKKHCQSKLSEDMISLFSGFLSNIKKKTLDVSFSKGRLDITFTDVKFRLSTVDINNTEPLLSIRVPVKVLMLIKNIMEDDGCEVLTDMEVICLTAQTRGLILSGPIY